MIYRIALLVLILAKIYSAEINKPNIVFILCDDMGWRDPGFMGSDLHQTPHMDRLAREGMTFLRAYANCPNCAPSRAAFMSGMMPTVHGVYTVGNPSRGDARMRKLIPHPNVTHLSSNIKTIAETLHDHGYATCHAGKWHLGSGKKTGPEGQGFDYNIGGNKAGSPPGGYFAPFNAPNITDAEKGVHLCDHITGKVIKWLDQVDDKPFFLYLSYYDVHTPLQAKPDIKSKYKKIIDEKKPILHKHATYAAMMETTDTNIGKVLAWLDERGQSENTIVVLFSDNGGFTGATTQTPLRGCKGMMYEGGIRVPMAVRWPAKIKAGSTCDVPIQGTDFYPTLCAVTGAEAPEGLVGVDISPLWSQGGPIAKRDLIWHFPAYLQGPGNHKRHSYDGIWRSSPCSVLMNGVYKLIHYFEDDQMELFNLKDDIGEQKNLIERNRELAAAMRSRLDRWRLENNAPIPSDLNPKFSPEAHRQLRAKHKPYAKK